MPEEQKKQSFGQYLQSMRMEAGLDLEHLSAETKIGKDILAAIEEENHGKLPEPVYVMGFIRSYASIVGADGDWAVRDYARRREEFVDLRQSESEYSMRSGSGWPRMLTWIIVATMIAAAAYFGYSYYHERFGTGTGEKLSEGVDNRGVEKKDDRHEGDESPETSARIETEDFVESSTGPDDESETTGADERNMAAQITGGPAGQADEAGHELVVEATEKTWVKILVDGKDTKEYNLKPGDKIVVEAESKYNILIGNAGGVKMDLDGKPLRSPGKSGQVVNVELP